MRLSWPAGLAVLLYFAQFAISEDFCAVRVSVKTDVGSPAASVSVALLDPNGSQVALVKTTSAGIAEFCDFDFGRHTLVIGPGSCGERRVADIQIEFGREQMVYAVSQDCPFGEVISNVCDVWLRVRSTDGRAVPGANVKAERFAEELRTDGYGRAIGPVFPGTTDTWHISAEGFESQELPLRCSAGAPDVIHETVTLRPKGN